MISMALAALALIAGAAVAQTTGEHNVGIGDAATGASLTTGNHNFLCGPGAGRALTTQNDVVIVGRASGAGFEDGQRDIHPELVDPTLLAQCRAAWPAYAAQPQSSTAPF